MKKLGVREVVAIGIGTALFVVVGFVSIPLGFVPNTDLYPKMGILGFFAALFGPVVGLAIGLIGDLISSLIGGGIWWSWLIPMGVPGLCIGLFASKYHIEDGTFGTKEIVTFNIAQVIGNAIAWIFLAPVLDIIIYAEPANKVFFQGIWAFIGNIICTAIIGTLLILAYSKIAGRSTGLKKED
ncbi:MAG: ECF-type riboflavin transporter substrate-binding protein [Lachnospiraceae bacterium]|nr:ECF-type riboflavin transporter substrate-binding protein [Lachnospiraceae bacterium]